MGDKEALIEPIALLLHFLSFEMYNFSFENPQETLVSFGFVLWCTGVHY